MTKKESERVYAEIGIAHTKIEREITRRSKALQNYMVKLIPSLIKNREALI